MGCWGENALHRGKMEVRGQSGAHYRREASIGHSAMCGKESKWVNLGSIWNQFPGLAWIGSITQSTATASLSCPSVVSAGPKSLRSASSAEPVLTSFPHRMGLHCPLLPYVSRPSLMRAELRLVPPSHSQVRSRASVNIRLLQLEPGTQPHKVLLLL